MKLFIFPGTSYAVGFGLDEETVVSFKKNFEQEGVRFVHLDSIDEFAEVSVKIKHFVGIYINLNSSISEEFLSTIESIDTFKFIANSDSRKNFFNSKNLIVENDVKNLVAQTVQWHVPPRLDELASFSANFIYGSLFPDLDVEFTKTNSDKPENYQFLVQCDTRAFPFAGRCFIYVNSDNLIQEDQSFADFDVELLTDGFKEFANQYLGIVNHNLLELGYSPKIGLPSIFSKDEASKLRNTGLAIPFVNISDNKGVFYIRLGFVNENGGEGLNLDSMNLSTPDDEISFF